MVVGPHQVNVTTTVQPLVPYDKDRTAVSISNLGAAAVYWSYDPDVTTSTGFPINAGQTATFNKVSGSNPKLKIYLVAGATIAVAIVPEYGEAI